MDLPQGGSALEDQALPEKIVRRDPQEHVALGVVALRDELADVAVLRGPQEPEPECLHSTSTVGDTLKNLSG